MKFTTLRKIIAATMDHLLAVASTNVILFTIHDKEFTTMPPIEAPKSLQNELDTKSNTEIIKSRELPQHKQVSERAMGIARQIGHKSPAFNDGSGNVWMSEWFENPELAEAESDRRVYYQLITSDGSKGRIAGASGKVTELWVKIRQHHPTVRDKFISEKAVAVGFYAQAIFEHESATLREYGVADMTAEVDGEAPPAVPAGSQRFKDIEATLDFISEAAHYVPVTTTN